MKKSTYTVEEAKKALERFCAYQERCHIEVERKLDQMNMIPAAKELIILHLHQEDYLNEERFARSFIRGKFNQKGWGKLKINNELRLRNVSEQNMLKAWTEVDHEAYLETLDALIQKKYASLKEEDHWIKKNKVYKYLRSKGYESEFIQERLKQM